MRSMIHGIGMTSQRTRDRLVERLRSAGITDPAVLEVIGSTPRHLFVDEALASRAYEETALPIGHGQTISQPYTVARMSELVLGGTVPEKVLEVGTGSGYQSAVLARLVSKVYSVERIGALLDQARQRLRLLGLRNVRLAHSDGSWGWPEMAPFDAIVVTAGSADIPEALLTQLALGGRLVMPVGTHDAQRLVVVTRREKVYEREDLDRVSFVPLRNGAS
ncbi:MAG: protein-L-isoaspartate(D-aspartate) O-methyltransferase [Gammaproteobacteria bacterium]